VAVLKEGGKMSSTHNELDADASTPIQPIQGSIQAQNTLPSALPTTLTRNGQNVIVLQLKSKQERGKPINNLLIIIAIILIAVVSIVWVLNITDTIEGPWSSICAALFTSVGTIIVVLQSYFQFTIAPTPAVTTTPLLSGVQPPDALNEDFSIPRSSGKEGVLVLYTRGSLQGFSVAPSRSFWEDTNAYAAQNIVERKIGGHTYYIAIFKSLPPGH
jgi:hypothetical protein